jgi:hypothetical protein
MPASSLASLSRRWRRQAPPGHRLRFRRRCRYSTYSVTLRIVSRGIGLDGSGPGARGHLRGPRQCLRVDILPDVRHFAILNGNGEDPMVFERPIRGFDSSRSEADDQNPVSLRYELGGALGMKFPLFWKPSEANPPIPHARGACRPAASPRAE